MYARMPRFDVGPENIDASIQYFKEASLPRLHKLTGFEGATLLVDRQKGIVTVITQYSNMEALDSSRSTAQRLRDEFMSNVKGSTLMSVEEYEVAVRVGQAEMAGAARHSF